MATKLPRYLWLNPTQCAEVILDDFPGLGSCQTIEPRQNEEGSEVVAEIRINAQQSIVAQYHIMMHELMHLVAETLKSMGVIRRQPDEAFITNAAGPLFSVLACNGMIRDMTTEEACDWFWYDAG